MSERRSARVYAFPSERILRPETGETDAETWTLEEHDMHHLEDGALALEMEFFDIDEPDPLVIAEGRNSDLVSGPAANVDVVQTPQRQRRRSRLLELHPLDLLIITGIVSVLAFI